ncbi:unnamed protein product [Paramecium pentaurelia]|uniref:Transmembrane protein n=1 Tax=Paramecium pentaurelia TaxID=43138 RepID=A0A8S1VU32_9CILI|nr:unnamed protein product [Paramecium pentaurelia]
MKNLNIDKHLNRNKSNLNKKSSDFDKICNNYQILIIRIKIQKGNSQNQKKGNNVLEEKLSQTNFQLYCQSKDQEFTELQQSAIITSQEQHTSELKSKLGCQKEQNQGLRNQLEQVKEIAEQKKSSENVFTIKIIQVERDYNHLQQTFQQHKEQLKQKLNELTVIYGKSLEQICLLSQFSIENKMIKKIINNYNLELKDIHKSKQFLIEFLEQKLLGFKEQNQQLKLLKKISIKNKLGCKTNNLGEECSRLNNIIKQRDDQIYRLQVQLKDLMNINGKNQYQEDLLDLLQTKEGEINILKEQNETSQHKQLQKFAEDAKINISVKLRGRSRTIKNVGFGEIIIVRESIEREFGVLSQIEIKVKMRNITYIYINKLQSEYYAAFVFVGLVIVLNVIYFPILNSVDFMNIRFKSNCMFTFASYDGLRLPIIAGFGRLLLILWVVKKNKIKVQGINQNKQRKQQNKRNPVKMFLQLKQYKQKGIIIICNKHFNNIRNNQNRNQMN